MLLRKNIKTKKIIAITIIAIAVVLASPFVYVYAFNGNILGWKKQNTSEQQIPSINYGEPTKEQVDAGNEEKGGKDTTDVETPKGENVVNNNPALPNEKSSATVSIINAGSADSNGNVNIRASVNVLDPDGVCTLTVTYQSGTIVSTQKATTQPQSSYSSCLGFTVSKGDIQPGTYTTKIDYSSKTHEGSASASFKL